MNNTLEQLQGKSSFPQNSFYYTCRKKPVEYDKEDPIKQCHKSPTKEKMGCMKGRWPRDRGLHEGGMDSGFFNQRKIDL